MHIPTLLPIVRQATLRCSVDTFALDIGMGNGRHAIYLAGLGFSVDAIDMSLAAVDKVNRYASNYRLPLRARVHDLREDILDCRNYGLVLCTQVLHHLCPSRASILLESSRAQAEPGTLHVLAAITRQGDFFHDSELGAGFFPDSGELRTDYHEAGWNILNSYEQKRKMVQRRADGTSAENLVSFLIARKPFSELRERGTGSKASNCADGITSFSRCNL
jgi:tellurite methyltransferase